MDHHCRRRLPIAAAALILACFIRDGFALSTSLLIDADQGPSAHRDERTAASSGSGCGRLVGCAAATGEGASGLPQPQDSKNLSAAVNKEQAPAPATQPTHLPQDQNGKTVKINKPAKKSHPGDPALVQPASQYHYYGGSTEERKRRNARLYPAPMKRKYADYSRLKRNVRLSPKDMLALLSLWERPLTIDDSAPVIPTESSQRRYFKHEDVDPELVLEDDEDDDNEYGIERSRDPWSESRQNGRRYFPEEPYRGEIRERKRNWQRQRLVEEQHLEARKRFERLVQDQLDELRRERDESRGRFDSGNMAPGEWGPTEYKRRSNLGTARYKPEEAKFYRWLQLQEQ